MTRQPDSDRVLEDWLAEGPSRLPDRVIRATVDQLDDIQQRRLWWLPRSERMNRILLPVTGVAAALIVAVVGLVSLYGTPGPGGPSGTSYTSDRHAYTVVLPDGWTREELPGTWSLGEFFDPNTDSGLDYFERLEPKHGPPLYVYLSSQPIPAGMNFDQWAATHDTATSEAQPCFEQVGIFERVDVDTEVGRLGVHRCENFGGPLGDAWTTIQVLVAHGGRGYAIYLWPVWTGPAMPPVDDLRRESSDWLSRFSFTN
jgi:hypothetical protein